MPDPETILQPSQAIQSLVVSTVDGESAVVSVGGVEGRFPGPTEGSHVMPFLRIPDYY